MANGGFDLRTGLPRLLMLLLLISLMGHFGLDAIPSAVNAGESFRSGSTQQDAAISGPSSIIHILHFGYIMALATMFSAVGGLTHKFGFNPPLLSNAGQPPHERPPNLLGRFK